ncbi:MAG TPA: argininosuccinate synthase, partial [Synergistales bacterium]|nr:argininosuccinate synthase [Synergistales bacterium]
MEYKGKVVLAYSGGLDTSVAVKWLQDQGYDVVTFTADVGQNIDLDQVKMKALA